MKRIALLVTVLCHGHGLYSAEAPQIARLASDIRQAKIAQQRQDLTQISPKSSPRTRRKVKVRLPFGENKKKNNVIGEK